MKVKFYLDNSSKVKEKTIWCYVREQANTLTLNTGEAINPNLWDKSAHRAGLRKTKNKILKGSLDSLNNYLHSFELKVHDTVRSIRSKDFNASFSYIAEELRRQFNYKEESLFDIYDEFLKDKKLTVSKDALQKYKRVKGLLQEFDKKLTYDKINPLFFSKFFSFLIEKGHLNNTAHKTIQFLKTFLIWSNTNGYADNKSYTTFKASLESNEVIYLTEEELDSLYNMIPSCERLKRVRDLFVFQCYTGVRYSDIQNISRVDIQGTTWKFKTQKTKKNLEIPLSNRAMSILGKYSEYPQPLPVITNQKMNKYLKELCEEAGIDSLVKLVRIKGTERIETVHKKYEVIGSHTARRTFISLSLMRGMEPAVIMSITGHSDFKMMKKYLDISNNHKKQQMEKAWGSPLRVVK